MFAVGSIPPLLEEHALRLQRLQVSVYVAHAAAGAHRLGLQGAPCSAFRVSPLCFCQYPLLSLLSYLLMQQGAEVHTI